MTTLCRIRPIRTGRCAGALLAILLVVVSQCTWGQPSVRSLDRFDDVAVVQVYADGFASLSLRDKTLAWHLYLAALAEVGLLLFGVTVALNIFARLLVWRVGKLPEGGRI